MDLDSMKATWMEMSKELEKQKTLTNEIILKMAHEKSSSRINRIVNMELFGIAISLGMLIYVLINYQKLTSWLSITGGIVFAIVIVLGIVMSFNIIMRAKSINVLTNTYTEALDKFNSLRKILGLYKRLSIGINMVLPFLIIPVFSATFFEKDLLEDMDEYKESLIYSFILIPPMMYLLFRYYKRNVRKIKDAINDIE